MYEIGKVYIWQNQVGEYAVLNGTECTPVEPAGMWGLTKHSAILGQLVDTWWDGVPNGMVAFRDDLRPKNPPPGEQLINEMFYVNVTA